MRLLDRAERRFGHWAVPNVVLILIIAQLVLYACIIIGRVDYGAMLLVPKAVFGGEWWRLISFMLAPPSVATSLFQALFLAFFLVRFLDDEFCARSCLVRFSTQCIFAGRHFVYHYGGSVGATSFPKFNDRG